MDINAWVHFFLGTPTRFLITLFVILLIISPGTLGGLAGLLGLTLMQFVMGITPTFIIILAAIYGWRKVRGGGGHRRH